MPPTKRGAGKKPAAARKPFLKPAKAPAKAGPKRHPNAGKQTTVPGTESKKDGEIETVAKDLDDARKQAGAWGRTVATLNDRLVGLLEAKKLSDYHRGEVHVALAAKDPKKTAKVEIGAAG